MTTRISCPYCNTTFAPDAVLPGCRLECPRCGETFPAQTPDGATQTLSASLSTRNTRYSEPRKSRRGLIAIVLGLGLVGLGIGMGRNLFRSTTPQPATETGPNATATPPVELAGLAFLPNDCNFVLAIQPGPLLAHAERTNQEPREMLLRAGLPASAFTVLDKAGIPLQQIDQIVLGVPVGDAAVEFRLTLVLLLRHPLQDEEPFLRALDAKHDPRGKPRYTVTLNVGMKLPLLLVRVSPTVWVFGNADADLAPAEHGGGGLASGFHDMIAMRLSPDTAIWAAADAGKWAEKPLVKLVSEWAGEKQWLPVVSKGQAAVVGLSFGDTPRVRLFVRCVDDPTGAALRDYFQTKAKPDVHTGGGGEWAMYDAPFDPQTGLQSIKTMLSDAK